MNPCQVKTEIREKWLPGVKFLKPISILAQFASCSSESRVKASVFYLPTYICYAVHMRMLEIIIN